MDLNYKNKIKIICDSSIDLPNELIEEEDIEVLHFQVTLDNVKYYDGVTITVDKMYELVRKTKQLPKTSAFGPDVFLETAKKFSDYESIIFIGIGSGFSSSFNSSRLGTMDLDNVYCIDSKNLSSGTGLLVLKMIKLRKEGFSAKEIVSEIERIVPKVRTQFAVNTLEFLHMGGRCSGASKLLGTMLRLKPIIKVIDGKMTVAKKPIGFHKALNAMLDECIKDKENIDLDHIMVTHSKADDDAKYLIEKLSKHFDKNIIMETYASGTISTHCGPRTIGILYIVKE